MSSPFVLRRSALAAVELVSAMVCAAALSSCADAPATARPPPAASFERSDWLADFAQLKSGLEAGYANLAWKGSTASDVDLPALERRTRDALNVARSDAQGRQALLGFIGQFEDGHLSNLPTLGSSDAVVGEPPAAELDPADPVSGCAALGYASTAVVAFSLPFETLPGFRVVSDGIGTPFRSGVGILPDGRKIAILRLQLFRGKAYPAVCTEAWRTVVESGGKVDRSSVSDAFARRWFSDLAAQLGILRSAGAAAVLVDVGRNSGGNDTGDWIPRMFTDRAVRSARLWMVDGSPATRYFAEQQHDLTDALGRSRVPEATAAIEEARRFFAGASTSVGRQRCDLSWVWQERRPWRIDACNRLVDARYAGGFLPTLPKGSFGDAELAAELSGPSKIDAYFGSWTLPTFVWIDGRSYSSAEMFAAVMKDQGIATLIGTRTGRDGCGSMVDTDPLVLAHSGLRFRMPNCVRLRADDTNEVAGIAPDIPLPPVAGESERARAARAMAAMQAALPTTSSSRVRDEAH